MSALHSNIVPGLDGNNLLQLNMGNYAGTLLIHSSPTSELQYAPSTQGQWS